MTTPSYTPDDLTCAACRATIHHNTQFVRFNGADYHPMCRPEGKCYACDDVASSTCDRTHYAQRAIVPACARHSDTAVLAARGGFKIHLKKAADALAIATTELQQAVLAAESQPTAFKPVTFGKTVGVLDVLTGLDQMVASLRVTP